jgi:hypothetical protein
MHALIQKAGFNVRSKSPNISQCFSVSHLVPSKFSKTFFSIRFSSVASSASSKRPLSGNPKKEYANSEHDKDTNIVTADVDVSLDALQGDDLEHAEFDDDDSDYSEFDDELPFEGFDDEESESTPFLPVDEHDMLKSKLQYERSRGLNMRLLGVLQHLILVRLRFSKGILQRRL